MPGHPASDEKGSPWIFMYTTLLYWLLYSWVWEIKEWNNQLIKQCFSTPMASTRAR